MEITYVDHMGDDLRVVNAARVSFNKESNWEMLESDDWWGSISKILSEKDQRLITYLAKHNHWTTFSHVMITMREKVPIFVARQRFKHMVGFTYNEVSRRYVDYTPEFYTPSSWRNRPDEGIKQGSGTDVVKKLKEYNGSSPYSLDLAYENFLWEAENLYNAMIDSGVAPEQARMVLPQSMYTEYYVTGSLAAWARAYKLRTDGHAQKEIQDLAVMWNDVISNISELKYSWSALIDH